MAQAPARRVDDVVQDADQAQRHRHDEHPARHRNAEKGPVDVAALTAAGHDAANDLEQRKHLQQIVERGAAGRHRARRLVLDPDVTARHPGSGARREQNAAPRRRWRRCAVPDAVPRSGTRCRARRCTPAGTCTAGRARSPAPSRHKIAYAEHGRAEQRAHARLIFCRRSNMCASLSGASATQDERSPR